MKIVTKNYSFVVVNFSKIGQEMTVYTYLFEKKWFYMKYIGKIGADKQLCPLTEHDYVSPRLDSCNRKNDVQYFTAHDHHHLAKTFILRKWCTIFKTRGSVG